MGCANRDWRQAQRANTGEAYRSFVTENAGHRRVPLAVERAEALDWAQAVALDTPDAYFAYYGAYPNGVHAADALAQAETRAWDDASAAGTPEALSTFLARFQQSTRREEAESLMEAAWYERAVAENTEDAWSRYLVRYPNGQFRAAAGAERERLAWEATIARNERSAYEAFAARYPFSERREQALAWIRASRVTKLQPVVLLGSVESVGPDARVSLARAVRRMLDDSLLYDLQGDFEVGRTVMVDLRGGPAPDPQSEFGVQPDTGLLVLTYRDEQGRPFAPSGRATDITVDLALYAPPSKQPTWSTTFEASTPDEAFGNTERALREAALSEMGSMLRGLADELLQERRK